MSDKIGMEETTLGKENGMTDTELIASIIASSLAHDWKSYASLKSEFFSRLSAKPGLAAEAEKAAHWAGLATF
jgi:hypothetical protein